MDLTDIIAQIEEELTWRLEELKFFKNQLAKIDEENDRMRYRKSLVVMLYSHYEGFCKAAFQIYIKAINNLSLTRDMVNEYIQTASLHDVFKSYHDESKKSPYFRKDLPDDTKLHRYSRQVELVSSMEKLWKEIVVVPETIVDTESNLKPIILRKILFLLGFQQNCLQEYEGQINHLLARRNNVAHGAQKEGLTKEQYEEIETVTLTIMEQVRKLILDALINKHYLKRIS